MFAGNNPSLAAAYYREGIALNPTNSRYHNNLGIAYGQLGKLEQAKEEFTTAVQLDYSDPLPQCNLGYVYYLNHDIAQAEQCWQIASSLDSNITESEVKLMNLYARQKKFDLVRSKYEHLVRLGINVDSTILNSDK